MALLAGACTGSITGTDNNDDVAPSCDEGYEPMPVEGYVAKTKMLLTGVPVTNEDLVAVRADPAALRDLLRQWLATDEGRAKLRGFFSVAFQQGDNTNNLQSITDTMNGGYFRASGAGPDHVVGFGTLAAENFKESFARTAVYYMENNLSFADLMQTDTYMMTSAMALVLGHREMVSRGNDGRINATPGRAYPPLKFVRGQAISIDESLDPASPNFWTFATDAYPGWWPDCIAGNEFTTTITTTDGNGDQLSVAVNNISGLGATIAAADIVGCASGQTNAVQLGLVEGGAAPPIGLASFYDWKMTKVIQADQDYMGIEALTAFRKNQPLVLRTPRVGFYTTPAFLALWQTNDANSFRVTANQSLIAGLGMAFAPNENIVVTPEQVEALDEEHVDPTSPCFGCHQSLDPMRQIFLSEFNVFNSIQTDAEERAKTAHFAFAGSNEALGSLADLGRVIAANPGFAEAWVQKLCFFANSQACPTDSQQFKDLALGFETSGFNFGELVVDLFSSPLVTGTSCVANDDGDAVGTGDIASISRRDHFCAALANRTGIANICSLSEDAVTKPFNYKFFNLVRSFSADAFPRGSQTPLTVSEPGMIPRIMQENFCKETAQSDRVVGDGAVFDSALGSAGVVTLVTRLMGLPPEDPRHAEAVQLLTEHFESAKATSNDRTAMQSTFIVACMAPSLIGVGL